MPRNKSDNNLRRELAHTAAKLIAVDGMIDYLAAKKKAAEQMGIQQSKYFPSNMEIEQALIEYQRLFQSDSQPLKLQELRRCALQAMKLFEDFNPYLVGPVLSGTASENSEITLHIFSDNPETIDTLLIDNHIPYELCERHAKFNQTAEAYFPAFRFFAKSIPITLIVFPERQRNHSPLSPTDAKPMARANYNKLTNLMQDNQPL